MPSVSVVIPCFNSEKYLSDAINSVIGQNHQDIEIIVVDDGSTDNTKQIALSFPDVKYFHHQNSGVSYSRNRGLKESRGEYIIFLDSDDLLVPGRIEHDLSLFEAEPELGYVFGWAKPIDEFGVETPWQQPDEINDIGYHTVLSGSVTVPPGTITFKAELVRAINGFNVDIDAAEDFDLYLRFSRRFSIHCHNRASLFYRRHDNNWSAIHGAVKTLDSLLSRLQENEMSVQGNTLQMNALKTGRKHWISLIGPRCVDEVFMNIKSKNFNRALRAIFYLSKTCPSILFRHSGSKVVGKLTALTK